MSEGRTDERALRRAESALRSGAGAALMLVLLSVPHRMRGRDDRLVRSNSTPSRRVRGARTSGATAAYVTSEFSLLNVGRTATLQAAAFKGRGVGQTTRAHVLWVLISLLFGALSRVRFNLQRARAGSCGQSGSASASPLISSPQSLRAARTAPLGARIQPSAGIALRSLPLLYSAMSVFDRVLVRGRRATRSAPIPLGALVAWTLTAWIFQTAGIRHWLLLSSYELAGRLFGSGTVRERLLIPGSADGAAHSAVVR